MYTLPLATVGTVNFTAFPAVSRPPVAWELFHNSVATLLALYACKMAGPAAVLALLFVP
jgi:hypothetical protein